MNKLQRSWSLFKCSVSVVLRNKKLLVFPVLSFVFTMVILAFVITPVVFQPTGHSVNTGQHWKTVSESLFVVKSAAANTTRGSSNSVALKPMAMAVCAVIYLVSMFLATFFNVAFFQQILTALRGAPVSVTAGLKFAISKLKPILLWSLFAGLIGLLIKTLEQRLEFIGRIILRLVGTAWSLASVFVIPVIIVEPETNPFSVLKKSAFTLKKTWGESLLGYIGLQFGGMIAVFSGVFLLITSAVLSSMLHTFWIFAAGAMLSVAVVITISYLTSVANQVYRCALYLYAAEGNIPQPYNSDHLQMAWKTKNA